MKSLLWNGDEIDRYITEFAKKEEYKGKEYSYITDIQRFDKFLQQFGIDISVLEKVTLNEAKTIFSKYDDRSNEIIKSYLNSNGNSTFIVMTEKIKEQKIREIIEAIKEGEFAVTPEMLGVRKKSFLKRFFEFRRNKNVLDKPKKDITEGAGLKQDKPTGDGNFVPRVEISAQPEISAIPEDIIENDEKEVAE